MIKDSDGKFNELTLEFKTGFVSSAAPLFNS